MPFYLFASESHIAPTHTHHDAHLGHNSLICGGQTSKIDPDSAGVHPAWRKAAVHVVTGAIWPEGAPEDVINQSRQVLKDDTAMLRALAPDSGAYFNEVCFVDAT